MTRTLLAIGIVASLLCSVAGRQLTGKTAGGIAYDVQGGGVT